jgi:hypothetical protein
LDDLSIGSRGPARARFLVAFFWIEFACENNAFLGGKPGAAPFFWS